LGTLLLEIERHEEALKYLQYSLDLHGPAPGTEYNMAVCYFSLGQTREAQAYLEQAIELDPDFEEAIALAAQLQ
jgi:tetratricopeptide (TPR) repeat protein